MRISKIWGILLCALFITFCYIPVVNASTNINWTPAGQLAQGDILKTSNSKIIHVVSIKKKPGTQPMYNLTINQNHDFFISAFNDHVLVHNCQKNITAVSTKVDKINDASTNNNIFSFGKGVNCLGCAKATYLTFSRSLEDDVIMPTGSAYKIPNDLRMTQSKWLGKEGITQFLNGYEGDNVIIRGELNQNAISGLNISARFGGHYFNAVKLDDSWYFIDSFRGKISFPASALSDSSISIDSDIYYGMNTFNKEVSTDTANMLEAENANGTPFYTGRFKIIYPKNS